MRRVTATEAKARLLSLLDDVETGESIEVTRDGRLVAKIVPARGSRSIRGRFASVVRSKASDEELFSTGVEWDAQ